MTSPTKHTDPSIWLKAKVLVITNVALLPYAAGRQRFQWCTRDPFKKKKLPTDSKCFQKKGELHLLKFEWVLSKTLELDCVDPWWSHQFTGLKLIQRRSRSLGRMINFEYSIIVVGDTDTVDGWILASNITFSHLCTSRDLNKVYLLDTG